MNKTGAFDCHCHTWNSPDSKSTPDQVCEAAIDKGLGGIAFTDHCNVNYWPEQDVLSIVSNSVCDAQRMQELYGDRLTVLRGVELGNHIYNPDIVKRVLEVQDLDIVVGSVHAIKYDGWDRNIAKMDFKQFPQEWIHSYLESYFQETLRMAAEDDIDAVAHFSFGVRYIACHEGGIVDISPHWNTIEQTLQQMLKRSVALEMNSNNIVPRKEILGKLRLANGKENCICDVAKLDLEIAKRYYELGGRLITLGSDSHAPDRVGRAFEQVIEKLKSIGFEKAYYFQNRKPISYEI